MLRRRDLSRIFTIGVSVLGSAVVVASAAHAGWGPPGALHQFYDQQLSWSPCDFDATLECTSVAVPLDYERPRGERLTIGISRLEAADPSRRRGVLVSVNGGPDGRGGGLGRALPIRYRTTELHQVYDLIGIDNRGVGSSSPLRCEVTTPRAPFDSRPPDSQFAQLTVDTREREEGCARAEGDRRRHFHTQNSARDLDVVRGALGERKLSYLGYAYGSYLGAMYGTMFGHHMDRHVLDSARNPEWTWRQQFMAQAVAIRANVDRWAQWVGERDSHFGLGASRAAVIGTVEQVAARLAITPVNGMNRSALDGAVGSMATQRPQWAQLAELVAGLRAGGHSAAAADAEDAAEPTSRPQLREGLLDTVTCEGGGWPSNLEVYYRDMRRFRDHNPYGFGVSRAQPWVCTFQTFGPPTDLVRVRRAGFAAGLVVQAEGDTLTHYDGGPAMANRLRDRLVTVADEGHNEIFGVRGNSCVDTLVLSYLLDGSVPHRDVTCAGSPRPDIPTDPSRGRERRATRIGSRRAPPANAGGALSVG